MINSEDFKKELEKSSVKHKARKNLLNMLADITGDPTVIYYLKQDDLIDLFHKIGMNMRVVSSKQYEDLTNMVEQFKSIVLEYLNEHNIVLKDEDWED